jgi:hypothetical protein
VDGLEEIERVWIGVAAVEGIEVEVEIESEAEVEGGTAEGAKGVGATFGGLPVVRSNCSADLLSNERGFGAEGGLIGRSTTRSLIGRMNGSFAFSLTFTSSLPVSLSSGGGGRMIAARFGFGSFVDGSCAPGGRSNATRRSGRGEFARLEGAEEGGVGR